MLSLSRLRTRSRFPAASGGTPAPTPGVNATAFSTAPTWHFHPNSQTATLGANDRVESCPDLRGAHPLTAPAGVGPFQLTDDLGRKFWRFNGTEWAAIANSFTLASIRGFTVVCIMRVPHQRNSYNVLMPRYATFTSDTVNTRAANGVGYMRGVVASNGAPFLAASTASASQTAAANATDAWKAIPSCELHLSAVASRTTANGAVRFYHGTQTCDVAQQVTAVTNYVGALLGASAASVDNTTAVVTSVNNAFDIYEIAFFAGELGNATTDALVAQAFANYGLTNFTNQIVCEGDSITDGIATALPVSPALHGAIGSRLTMPGASLVPASTRVINMGISGDQVTNLITKRDSATSWSSLGRIPGAASLNKLFVQIGRNDMSAGALSGDDFYTLRAVPYLNTASTGVLQRGWKVFFASNISTSSGTVQARIEAFRARILDGTTLGALAAFLTDCDAGPGGTYDGMLQVVPLSEITVASDTKFKTSADASDTASGYYDSDGTHLRVAGVDLMISGGDNSNRGWASRA